jgi:hypothetical protein
MNSSLLSKINILSSLRVCNCSVLEKEIGDYGFEGDVGSYEDLDSVYSFVGNTIGSVKQIVTNLVSDSYRFTGTASEESTLLNNYQEILTLLETNKDADLESLSQDIKTKVASCPLVAYPAASTYLKNFQFEDNYFIHYDQVSSFIYLKDFLKYEIRRITDTRFVLAVNEDSLNYRIGDVVDVIKPYWLIKNRNVDTYLNNSLNVNNVLFFLDFPTESLLEINNAIWQLLLKIFISTEKITNKILFIIKCKSDIDVESYSIFFDTIINNNLITATSTTVLPRKLIVKIKNIDIEFILSSESNVFFRSI